MKVSKNMKKIIVVALVGGSIGYLSFRPVDAAGTVVLSGDVAIEIRYDDDGNVVDMVGLNDESKLIVSKCHEFKGEDCKDILEDLSEDFANKTINISLKEGSTYPSDDFLTHICNGMYSCISIDEAKDIACKHLNIPASAYVEGKKDEGCYELEYKHNNKYYDIDIDCITGKVVDVDEDVKENVITTVENISEAQAKSIACKKLGVPSSAFVSCDKEDDHYDLEYRHNNTKYDIEVGFDGKVLDIEKETCNVSSKLSLSKAKSIACDKLGVPASAFVSSDKDDDCYELKYKHNNTKYEIEIGFDGTVLDIEKETVKSTISASKAKSIACKHFGLDESCLVSIDQDDDCYELEFYCDGYEYDIEIDCHSGKVLDSSKECDDDGEHHHHGHH